MQSITDDHVTHTGLSAISHGPQRHVDCRRLSGPTAKCTNGMRKRLAVAFHFRVVLAPSVKWVAVDWIHVATTPAVSSGFEGVYFSKAKIIVFENNTQTADMCIAPIRTERSQPQINTFVNKLKCTDPMDVIRGTRNICEFMHHTIHHLALVHLRMHHFHKSDFCFVHLRLRH